MPIYRLEGTVQCKVWTAVSGFDVGDAIRNAKNRPVVFAALDPISDPNEQWVVTDELKQGTPLHIKHEVLAGDL